jgi:hypothetical protein
MSLQPGQALRVAHLREPVIYQGPGVCRRDLIGCRQRILWALTAKRYRIPLNPVPNEHGYYVAHQATCPQARLFRRDGR